MKSDDPGDEAAAIKWNLLAPRQKKKRKKLLIKFSQSEVLAKSLRLI